MTSRERLRVSLEHEEPDRVPIDLGGSPTTIETHAYEPLKKIININKPTRTFRRDHVEIDEEVLTKFGIDTRYIRINPPDKWKLELKDDNSYLDEWGVCWKKPTSSLYFDPINPPLANATIYDLEEYSWPNPSDPGRTRGLKEKARKLYENTNYALIADMVGLGIFETAWVLRGMQNFFMDLIGNPEFAIALVNKIAEVYKGIYEEYMNAVGDYIEVVMLSDDLGMQTGPLISLKHFRDIIKPAETMLWSAIREKTKAKLFLHSCGGIVTFIPDLIDAGIDILNPIQVSAKGMDTAELKKMFGNNITFWGAIDEQTVLTSGSTRQVREEVRKRIIDLAPGGGYVLCAAHNIQGNVPPENVIAMYKAALEFGEYPINSRH